MFHSLKQVKIYALMLVCTIAFFALCGCAPKESAPTEEDTGLVRKYVEAEALESQKEGAYKITYPVTPEIIKKSNGITITSIDEDMSKLTESNTGNTEQTNDENTSAQEQLNISEGSLSYIAIDGLLNDEVEQKINDTIYTTAIELYNAKLPPYRGIRSIDFSKYTFTKNVNVYESANFSNILSVVVSLDICGYSDTDNYSDGIYITETVPLNFYLKTGEQFPIGDLFADNCDYKEIINGKVSDYLMKYNRSAGDRPNEEDFFESFSTISIVSPFKGISDNQKFIVNENSISLVIDYNMPEFDTTSSNEYSKSFMSQTISLDYSDPEISEVLGVFKRFETEESLYEKEREKSFISTNYPKKSTSVAYGSPEDFGLPAVTEGDIEIDMFTSMPITINNKALSDAINKKYDTTEDNLISLVKTMNSKYSGEQIIVSYSYNVTRLGKYLTEEESTYVYVNGEEEPKYSLNQSVRKVYDEKTGKEVTLSDLFKEGTDYRAELLQAIKTSRNEWWGYDTFDDETYLKIIDNGDLMLYQNALEITYEYPDGTYEYCNIPFEYLDQAALTIFD